MFLVLSWSFYLLFESLYLNFHLNFPGRAGSEQLFQIISNTLVTFFNEFLPDYLQNFSNCGKLDKKIIIQKMSLGPEEAQRKKHHKIEKLSKIH
jgi:hypothetical protein